MPRTFALALIAATVGAVTTLSTAASARTADWGSSLGAGYHGDLGGPIVVTESCVEKLPIQTRHGMRYRHVNVCAG